MNHSPYTTTRALAFAALTLALCSGCANTHKSVGVGSGARAGARVIPVGVSYTTSRMVATPIDMLMVGPTARYKIGPTARDIGLGAELMLRRPDDYSTPGFRVGFDALNLGCTNRTCCGGTGGMHGGFDLPIHHGERYHILLDLTLDRDVRIGPPSSNTLLLSLRWIPRREEN